uniref:Uncharacterized protein n=1 Tax=Scleropages formosus TaxID=113540 RepID=A0A8C9T223_SCLFO
MKWLGMLVVCTLLGSLGFGAFLYRKHKEHESLLRNGSYMETKVHVSRDVLSEYQADVAAMQEDVELIQKQMNDLSAAVEKEQAEYNGRKGEMDACQGDKVRAASVCQEGVKVNNNTSSLTVLKKHSVPLFSQKESNDETAALEGENKRLQGKKKKFLSLSNVSPIIKPEREVIMTCLLKTLSATWW